MTKETHKLQPSFLHLPLLTKTSPAPQTFTGTKPVLDLLSRRRLLARLSSGHLLISSCSLSVRLGRLDSNQIHRSKVWCASIAPRPNTGCLRCGLILLNYTQSGNRFILGVPPVLPCPLDSLFYLRYPYPRVRRDRPRQNPSNPPGPRGSTGKEVTLGAAGKPARRFLIMEDLPICNYEGSDYQSSFWERGGRAYEDAVEGVALKRLMPRGGRRLLELGAGAGRNTPRYRGFEQITLLDYSLTQLRQARLHLSDSGPDGASLRYVAADIYRLPFVPASFDAATMIRTLHHLVNPRRV